MRFMHPSLLAWMALLAVPIILYLFRRKPKKLKVSTLLFFKSLAKEHQESAWLRRLKRLLSFLLSAAVIAFATMALARLVISPPTGSLKSVVILVDRSASMAARDEKGVTRLEEAKALVRERLAGLPGGVSVSVMTYDARPEILLPRSLDRRDAERALASISVRPIEGDVEGALALARRVAALEAPSGIWHATDNDPHHQDTKGTKEASHGESGPLGDLGALVVEVVDVSLASPTNVGITAFQLRRLPLERARFEAFVQIHGASKEPVETQLEVRLDGTLVSVRRMTLEPGGRERLLVPVEGAAGPSDGGKTLSLRVSAEGDCLAIDDEVHARIPEVSATKVLWISPEPDPFVQLALTSLGDESDIEILHGGPDAWPPPRSPNGGGQESAVDVAIFDGWLPEDWPKEGAIIVMNPPRAAGPVRAVRLESEGLPLTAIRPVDERHPVLYGVATSRVELTQTAVLESDGPLEPLWVGPSGPVLAAGDVRGQRIVVMAFEPGRSERLPLMASFPLLVGNAIYWSAAAEAGGGPADTLNHRTGELVACSGGTITWSVPGPVETRESTAALRGRLVELDRVGLWRTEGGEEGSAALLSSAETSIARDGRNSEPQMDADGRRSERQATDDTASIRVHPRSSAVALAFRGDMTPLLMWAILAVLLLESWLFHRKAVY
ncbi:MAG: vWA domain-containing protein [Planctomycetota bacterium]|jgi:hypothetical protein